ncbi:MAG: ribosome recycling factor [Ignavibacteria bacterium]|nr:ribosome recycling factor [Ignavibacteria bacterium]MBK6420439.1 ribosome recycling factor [Ignavibacteria bacterium]MBK7033632.1 ribosome recycling factor [Ignavibacteria bacterium]MBK7186345.1 ribosome recycling factor [Ignavibacteria bacterium]MBK9183849.1 ribosome recycling factor [Ignavibacteria bacterium]
MPVKNIVDDAAVHMNKAVEHVQQQLSKVRTGRASASMLDAIKVEYYGEATPLAQVGSVSVPDARSIVIQPWDRTVLGTIEKAILAANLGITPQNDGQIIRISVPPLTEERRKDIVKQCKKMAEEGKLAVRNIRRDANEELKVAEKKEHFSEDDRKRGEDDIQKNTDRYIKDIDTILVAKEKEVMEE